MQAIWDVPLDAWETRRLARTEGSSLAAALAASLAASELLACENIDAVFRSAVELARGFIGLERAALYLRERAPGRILLRGTWGTGAHGETIDEHAFTHELSAQDGKALQKLRDNGACALHRPRARWIAIQGDHSVVLGTGWVMVTPLLLGNTLIGVLYNDAALSGGAVDASKQAAAAVLANFVAMEYASRCAPFPWEPPPRSGGHSALVEQVRKAVDRNLSARGHELASELGVSPGHLARVFKRGMGVSLVEYRNRKRMDRFWEAIERAGRVDGLRQAAFEAGFGSYAQFHRVYKKLAGERPQDFRMSGSNQAAARAQRPPDGSKGRARARRGSATASAPRPGRRPDPGRR